MTLHQASVFGYTMLYSCGKGIVSDLVSFAILYQRGQCGQYFTNAGKCEDRQFDYWTLHFSCSNEGLLHASWPTNGQMTCCPGYSKASVVNGI
jgi:hypothetical protein